MKGRKKISILLSLMTAACMLLHQVSFGETCLSQVTKAYELRMHGKSESAKSLLQSLLGQNEVCADAYYEMARLTRATQPFQVDEALEYCNQAIRSDTGNTHYLFLKGELLFLKGFIELQHGGSEDVRSVMADAAQAFRHVLALDDACADALLYLTEIYAFLPEEQGGDRMKAEASVKELEALSAFAGAKGKAILEQTPQEMVKTWRAYLKQTDTTREEQALQELGKAYLMSGDMDKADSCFKLTMKEGRNQVLLLEMARAYVYKVMQGEEKEASLNKIKALLLSYVNTTDEKPVPVEAWCYGLLSRVEMFLEDQEASDKYLQMAQQLDPAFSRALAVPQVDDPPGNLHERYRSFFRPY